MLPNINNNIETNWNEAQDFFKKRQSVLFISDCRFWETHGFVQQSLAYRLAEIGVKVIWIDGSDWRIHNPVFKKAPNLKIEELPKLPFTRIKLVNNLNVKLASSILNHYIKKLGGKPLIWIQSGFDERVIEYLPYVDVYSVFDDPYKHSQDGELCQKASLIITQNSFALKIFEKINHKTILLFPPVEMNNEIFNSNYSMTLPKNFPQKIMGYIGSFFPEGFDFELLRECLEIMPDWGFILMGRTNENGINHIKTLKQFPNFHYEPWVTRNHTVAGWKKLNLSTFLYKDLKSQDGAFAVKALESMHFGVPIVSTRVPKTEDISKYFPSISSVEELKIKVDTALNMNPRDIEKIYNHFSLNMDPRNYLTRVANFLLSGEITFKAAS